MSVDQNAQTLTNCAQSLGVCPDVMDTLDSGYLLLQSLSADVKLCDKVTQKLTGFGELLTAARDAYRDAVGLVQDRTTHHGKELPPLEHTLDNWNVTPTLNEMQQLAASLKAIDAKFADAESAFARLESWIRCLDLACSKHGRAKTTAGGVFIASGCVVLTLSAATFLIRCAVRTTGAALSPAASLIFRFSPLNTFLAGGVVTMIGVSDACHSQRYTRLTISFRDFAADLVREISASRSFRTRVQRLRNALDDMALSLHVTTAIHRIEDSTRELLKAWLPHQEAALKGLLPTSAI